ncbi:type II CRISPR RNA-guided endonuclease Cas9 [Apilactobacillus micheneri]|uniref:type II CRISPR RNA-guided endonuclease Cas9 n=1 Tax=Apilactobacillus micheneri TaxID=1899430 RepID=UPI00112D9CD6|nr:type II CRISPR RNA-guided endonuclease Cas9 [Apilactobacillus micheneri]TPR42408.1 type II CRISPR RNA-guided endonuclease Cas9 [Apilactobacillus micheneri]TPR47110.1 type II CRISPR RNA-guided endonuclease Cas9 [Apilactobacillus micheneri]
MKKYHIGLDIGTSSVGFAAKHDDGSLVHTKGKNVIGARLFNEGQTAEERRTYRAARRRYSRRRWRLNLLNQIFKDSLDAVDATFLKRLKESSLSNQDQNKKYFGELLFPKDNDKRFHTNNIPENKRGNDTIFHLRDRLMKSNEKADIREIYLAFHSMVKNRGNFFDNTPASSFEASDMHLVDVLHNINNLYEQMNITFVLNDVNAEKIEDILLDNKVRNIDKKKTLINLLQTKESNKESKTIITEIVKLILGYKSKKINIILGLEDLENNELCLSNANSDDQINAIFTEINEVQQNIINEIKTLYSRTKLNQIIPNGKTYSESMIDKYNLHHDQLRNLKLNILDHLDFDKNRKNNLKIAYAAYVGNLDKEIFLSDDFNLFMDSINNKDGKGAIKKVINGHKKKITQSDLFTIFHDLLGNPELTDTLSNLLSSVPMSLKDFENETKELMNNDSYSVVQKDIKALKKGKKKDDLIIKDDIQQILNNNPLKALFNHETIKKEIIKINQSIQLGNYLPKLRTSDNASIPHQINQNEMDQIIEKQKQYYPWLSEPNPNSNRKNIAKYKLDELIAFRIPYYVGPMITSDDQQNSSNANFAWMKRKASGVITPWNFEDKVDVKSTATEFIKRMTVKDTYLINEDVLPDNSLLYQEFKVLNELNIVKANGKHLTVEQKQSAFNDLFKKQKTVTAKKLSNYLANDYVTPPEITGLSDKEKFNNNYGSYIDMKKIFGDKIDDLSLRDDFEKMIEWSTIFEDRDILRLQLKDVKWLNKNQINQLISKRYSGWGRLSKRLLMGLLNDNGERIIDVLWNTPANFMQAVNNPDIKTQIAKINSKQVNNLGMESILDNAYTSPQNKKAIRQAIKVVNDIQRAMKGQAPASISIEFTRKPENNSDITKSRGKQVDKIYKELSDNISKDLKDELKTNKKNLSDKLYLYFMQKGRDIYTGESIDIDNLISYDIDHIIPRSYMKDDSLNNRVLTNHQTNHHKGDKTPLDGLSSININNQIPEWKNLLKQGLISVRKFRNLTTKIDAISKYAKNGFVHRQLVETSQVIKLVANILNNKYQNSDTNIIEVKAYMNTQLRETFDLFKSRELNDYHHALDAYLTTFAGTYLYDRYPKLRHYFVYGNFKKFDDSKTIKHLKTFNFLRDITSPSKEHEDKIFDKASGELILNRKKAINRIKKIYNYKYMLVTHEVSTRKSALYNQSIYPAKNVKKSFINIKNDKPVELYGGHTGNNNAYMALVKIIGKNGNEYKLVGVPIRFLSDLNRAKKDDIDIYQNKLHEMISAQLPNKKFTVLLDKVMYRQLVIDGDEKYTVGSATYKYNAKQLVISPESVRILKDKELRNSLSSKQLNEKLDFVYNDILKQVNKYLPLYDINSFRKKLNAGFDKFKNISDNFEKINILNDILEGLHDNPTRKNLKVIGLKTDLGMFNNGVKFSEDAIIIYQSPTGLFERKVRIKDL